MSKQIANLPNIRCSICGADQIKQLYRQANYDVMRCTCCKTNFVYSVNMPAFVEVEGEYDPELGKRYMKEVFIDRKDFWLLHWAGNLKSIEEILGRKGYLLDIGCAMGHFQLAAEQQGWTSTGVELSVEQANYARDVLGLDVHAKPFEEMNFASATFDLITLWSVIEHVEKPREFLLEVRRLMKPDGLLVLQTPNQSSLISLLADILYKITRGRYLLSIYSFEHRYRFSQESMDFLLRRAGFTPVKISQYDNLRVMLLRMRVQPYRLIRAVVLGVIHIFAAVLNRRNQLIVYARPDASFSA